MSSQWIDPYAGFEYATSEVVVNQAEQHQRLRACGIDPNVFAQTVDPSFYIGLAIQAGIKSGITAQGNINMLQRLRQNRPVSLGEVLTVEGGITQVEPVPRGRKVHTEVRFVDAQKQVAIVANRISLKPDPDASASRGAGDKPNPLVSDASKLIRGSSFSLTPEGVKAYSVEGNSIHYDQAAAEKAGFRAPLIGGGMGVHYLMAHLWERHPPQQLTADIYFRRPIFWDETVSVVLDEEVEPSVMALLKPGGKVGTELKLTELN